MQFCQSASLSVSIKLCNYTHTKMVNRIESFDNSTTSVLFDLCDGETYCQQ